MDETTRDIQRLLALRHPAPEWVFALEVPTTTGFATRARTSAIDPIRSLRRIDAFAMNMYPSRGFKRIAYEIKTCRSDWLSECANWAKMTQARFLADEMWIVAPEGVVIAADWREYPHLYPIGHLVAEGGALRKRSGAVPCTAWPMPEGFVAGFLRAAIATQRVLEAPA